ncbi:MAG: hypothetical protein RSC68_18385 [Acinetobacter sp.]
MHKLRSTFTMIQGQTSDWLHSPRTIISGIIVLALTYMNARSYAFTLESNELYSHLGEGFFYYLSSGFGNVTLVSALFLVMMAEIPRRTLFQNAMLIRASRLRWLMSQVLFCLMATALMMVLMLLLSMLMTLPVLTPGSGWSDLERLAANPEAEWMMELTPKYIRVISPLQASLLATVILFAFWFTMTLIILFCTLLGHPNLGLILYISVLVVQVTVLWEELPQWMRYMPVDFATLTAVGGKFVEHELKTMPIVICTYIGLDLLMIGLMFLKVRTMDLFFVGKDVNE